MTRYRVDHTSGEQSFHDDVKEWHVYRLEEPGTPETIKPTPGYIRRSDGAAILFDPRVRVTNLDTGKVEYDGPSLYTAVGDNIVRRRF